MPKDILCSRCSRLRNYIQKVHKRRKFYRANLSVLARDVTGKIVVRVLPEKIAYVHPKLRSPMLTIVIMFILGFPGIALQAGIVSIPINFIWVAVLLWTFIALSCFRLKKKVPDVWQTSPAWCKRKFLGISTFAWVAGVTIVILVWNLIGDFLVPAVGGSLTWETAAETFVMVIIGLVYLRRRQIKSEEGFDLFETFNGLPLA